MDIKNDFGTDLVSHWKLEEASGTRVDSHGSNDLTDNNTVGQGAGIQGDCADFESSNSEYLSRSTDFGIATTNHQISISLWVKFETTTGSQVLFWFNNDGGSSDFQWYLDLNQGGTKVLRLIDQRENIAQYTWSSIDTNWHHIVCTFTYNTASTGQKLYIDGTLVAQSSTGTASASTASDLFILGATQTPSMYLDGLMDEVSIWSRVLSSSEVSDIYNSGNGIPYEEESTGTNCQINIGDEFKTITEIYVNVGDEWKSVTEMSINVGDEWKSVF